MSAFTRILNHLPASRRAYSSFFSSKSGGGGRYFNSAKSSKSPVVAAPKAPSSLEPSPEPSTDASDAAGPQSQLRHSAKPLTDTQSESPSSPSSVIASDASSSQSSYAGVRQYYTQSHPVVSPKDFKLHQFFSLHRPLLLITDPSSILASAPASSPVFPSQPSTTGDILRQSYPMSPFDEPSDVTVDADAEAARQLTRALTLNKVGATMAWEDTLLRLGLDVNKQPDRIGLQKQWDREWQEVMMDSTKRKRRKKMKKHKLRKLRKRTRASRLKLK